MWAATRVNVEQASKRATRGPTRRITGKAGTGREASDARSLGQVSPAYSAVDWHAVRRLRRWLCLKHKVKTGKYVRFPNTRLRDEYGLTRLSPRTKGLLHAKA